MAKILKTTQGAWYGRVIAFTSPEWYVGIVGLLTIIGLIYLYSRLLPDTYCSSKPKRLRLLGPPYGLSGDDRSHVFQHVAVDKKDFVIKEPLGIQAGEKQSGDVFPAFEPYVVRGIFITPLEYIT